jgi:hypothetical protein
LACAKAAVLASATAAASEIDFIFIVGFRPVHAPTRQLRLPSYVPKAGSPRSQARASRAMQWPRAAPVCKFVAWLSARRRTKATALKRLHGGSH